MLLFHYDPPPQLLGSAWLGLCCDSVGLADSMLSQLKRTGVLILHQPFSRQMILYILIFVYLFSPCLQIPLLAG